MDTQPLGRDRLVRIEPAFDELLCYEEKLENSQTRFWSKRKPGERNDEIWLNMGAGGLGDSILALSAVRGLKRLYPERIIVYRIRRTLQEFIALFEGGYDGLAVHNWDEVKHDIPPDADPRDWQINAGYRQELAQQSKIPRLERYCRNLGVIYPVWPELREPERIRKLGKNYEGYIALCPFAAWVDREYPLFMWATLERLLRLCGYPTVVLGAHHHLPDKDPLRTNVFAGEVVMDDPPDKMTGILLNCACVIGNDSGLAHLSSIMHVPTIVLCGWAIGSKIFGVYPKTVCLQGVLACNGCWTSTTDYDTVLCGQRGCANLGSITPERILEEVVKRVSGRTNES